MREHFFDYINISPANIFLPDGTQTDSALECARYDRVIVEHGGIDLQLLGIGRNAHIGFNEPDVCFSRGTHQVTLTESTIAATSAFLKVWNRYQDKHIPWECRQLCRRKRSC